MIFNSRIIQIQRASKGREFSYKTKIGITILKSAISSNLHYKYLNLSIVISNSPHSLDELQKLSKIVCQGIIRGAVGMGSMASAGAEPINFQ